ncbi:hypothetical protein G5714_015367 [Onychostoma macrolepis]|uniref:Uncharacterized protein n=1 Tax=Onychostoma macrolepis TaxID=369639 RepID=A0A7J6CB00_9TELE|nr:hypothetical protein G5714_015367 [Onychostoma macrolepis]
MLWGEEAARREQKTISLSVSEETEHFTVSLSSGTRKAGRYTPHPVHSALTLPDKGIWVRLKLRKEPEDLASAETDEKRDTRETGRC